MLGVAPISANMCKCKLRWSGHVQKKTTDMLVKRVEIITIDGKRIYDSPKKTLRKHIRNDMSELYIFKDLTSDKTS